MDAENEIIYAFSSPVTFVELATGLEISGIELGIGEIDFLFILGNGVGVEVVVDVDAVDVVFGGDFHKYVVGSILDGLGGGNHPFVSTVGGGKIGVGRNYAVGAYGAFLGRVECSVGVEPGVDFDAAPMGFGDGEFEGVETVGGSFALGAGEVVAPRFVG